ncbi:hypothetical protein E1265_21310 [Streptomyces sp. 8K308]|uniref:hypothetical protein n=1 Tax=Streptomyces sp. 8K308 TaxID=2530388 RepID=UPI00104ECF05|nr:hypothetical protein [Streptomyces sp. 8K308]TDC20611.1 hypothetical protein E1265_21310 [Streptomyces sp. 8K308]
MTYKASDLLEKVHVPLLRKRPPYWQPKSPRVATQVITPGWNWRTPNADKTAPGREWVALDVNAAYLAAASSVNFAHGALERETGGGDFVNDYHKAPGYYLVDAHPWAARFMPSPLGMADLDGRVWLAHPTVEVLHQLSEAGYWPQVTIWDAYICRTWVRFRKWTQAIRDDRAAIIQRIIENPADDLARARYESIKTGYSIAIQMMVVPPDPKGTPAEDRKKKNHAYRPDWYHTIRTQSRANFWRVGWKAHLAGCAPVSMSNTDEMTFTREDLDELQPGAAGSPIRFDRTGIQIGSFKVKEITTVAESDGDEKEKDHVS